jgi:exodeoxyribonuclease VII large subunit
LSDLFTPSSSERDQVFSVSQLTGRIKFVLEEDFADVKVIGEISGYKQHQSGHAYFELKDDKARISAVMFRNSVARLRFQPGDGQKVEVRGSVTVYEPQGKYQISVREMAPVGLGELELRFRLLKEKLQKEGLFGLERKKRLPQFPSTIGIATSPTGAALQDMLRILHSRHPGVKIVLRPCLVQGEKAPADIIAALADLDAHPEVDVVIFGRGGGSYEDLFVFNDEALVRAVAAMTKPTVSAVGHESDLTISDLVADHRAATPTDAAGTVVPRLADTYAFIDDTADRLASRAAEACARQRMVLNSLRSSLLLHGPLNRLRMHGQRLDHISDRLVLAAATRLRTTRAALASGRDRLEALSPTAVLTRGFSMVKQDGRIVRSSSEVTVGSELELTFGSGGAGARVTRVKAENDDRPATQL